MSIERLFSHIRSNQSAKICAMQGVSNSQLEFYIYIDLSTVQGPAFARIIRGFSQVEAGGHRICGPLQHTICECGPCTERFAHPYPIPISLLFSKAGSFQIHINQVFCFAFPRDYCPARPEAPMLSYNDPIKSFQLINVIPGQYVYHISPPIGPGLICVRKAF